MSRNVFEGIVPTPGETLPEFTRRLMSHAACDYPTALREARRQLTARQIDNARTVDDLKPILKYLLELNGRN